MIFFLADGQLGNQIFQYTFLKSIQKNNEFIVVSGFEALDNVFETKNVIFLHNKSNWHKRLRNRLIKPFLDFLSNSKLISTISINREEILSLYDRETTSYTRDKGIFNNFTYVKAGYFQSESFFDKKHSEQLEIKNIYLQNAEKILTDIPDQTYKVFIHIRRGDYKNFFIYGQSTLLPLSYFKNQIEWFLLNRSNCFFIFLSDDSELIEKEFSYLSNKIISISNHYGTDLAIMTKCQSAILSPSSFSWWGAYLMKKRDIVFAPEYWLGFNSKVEFHKNTTPSFATKVQI